MSVSPLDQALERVSTREKLRVWSLIITFFGDAVVPRGGAVSARILRLVMQRLGIEEGAVRTALSRLANDGWVTRTKDGRASIYNLAERGALPFERASKRIYAAPGQTAPKPKNWIFARDEAGGAAALRCVEGDVEPGTQWLISDPSSGFLAELEEEGFLIVHGSDLRAPKWLREIAGPDEIANGFKHLQEDFSDLCDSPPAEPLEAVAARCLLIHAWRRLLLRIPDMPPALLPDDWPENECRTFVARLYRTFEAPSSQWLAEHLGPERKNGAGKARFE